MKFLNSSKSADIVKAIEKSHAVIEFEMDGTIITANSNFLGATGYSLEDIKGKHHSMFVESSYAQSNEYKGFWSTLNRGEHCAGEFKRFGKGGKEIWLQASYDPILDSKGKAIKVVKMAADITERKLQAAETSGKIDAIGKSQAVIEFDLEGKYP